MSYYFLVLFFFFFQAEDGIRDVAVTGVQTCALPILHRSRRLPARLSRVRRPEERNPGHPGPARPGALRDPQLRPRARLTRGHEALRREPHQGKPWLALVFPDHAFGAGPAAARRRLRPGHPLFGRQIHRQAGAGTLPRAEGFPDRPVREHPRDLYLDLPASASGDERHQDAVDGTRRKASLTRWIAHESAGASVIEPRLEIQTQGVVRTFERFILRARRARG